MRSGRKSAAQTPAPKKDRIYGSKTNPKGSASSEKSAKSIVLSDKTMKSLQGKLKEFKEKHPAKKNITLNDLKAVYRRGLGAYSSSHRPTITGGVPNTRNAWAMARVNKFLLKAGGAKVKKAYVQDDDLMERGGTIDKGAVNYAMPNVDWSEMPLIHETKKEIANKIKKDGFVVTTKNNTKGVYTIPTVLKKEKFNPNDVELIVWLKPDSKILWTNTENPSDFYVGYGNKFYQKIYKELNPNWERTLKNQSAFIGSDEQGKFCRKLEDWLSNNGYCGVQQGGEVVITDLDCIDYVEDRSEEFADGGTINYPFTVLIKNIKNPNDSYKSVKNMYRGAYQKIFDILDDDSIFRQWETEEEKLEGNDLYLYFYNKPDSDKVEKISKIPNVQIIESGILTAPNGKPSNLTPEQYELVRTHEFKAWFGDWENSPETSSKVVDENGEPLVVYHGTRKRFNSFDKLKGYSQNWYGLGFYFTDSKEDIEKNYTSKGKDYKDKVKNKKIDLEVGEYVFDVFLNIKNPLELFNKIGKNKTKILNSEKKIIEKYGYDVEGISIYMNKIDFEISTYWDLENHLRNLSIENENNENIIGEVIRAMYEIIGFDGIIMNPYHIFNELENRKMKVDRETNHYIAFYPEQIKLADGTNTTFDANSPDIRFADGGNLELDNADADADGGEAPNGLVRTSYGFYSKEFGKFDVSLSSEQVSIKLNLKSNGEKDAFLYLENIDKEGYIELDFIAIDNKYFRGKGLGELLIYIGLLIGIEENIYKGIKSLYNSSFSDSHRTVEAEKMWDRLSLSNKFVVKKNNRNYKIKLADGTLRFAEGGRFDDQELLKKYKAGESIGFTAIAHLKAKGLIARADGTKRKSDKYKEMGGNVDEEIKLPDLNMSYGALKKTLNYQGYDIEPMKQELQIGKVAKGMSVQQIAQHHNATVDEIQKQLDKGIQVEMEHTDNQDIARAIALDHVYESPVYYDKLETIEKEFKDGGVVVGKRHSEYDENGSGEKFLVESTGQVVELEGGEGVLCQESMSSDKKFSFEGKSMTGREIASYLNHKYGGVEFAKGGEVKKIDKIKADMPHVCGCKHQYYHGGEVPTAVVRNLKGGEAVVTVKSMESKDQYNFNGKPMTPRQIFSQINMASGGKKFEDGGVINLQSIKDDARLEFDIQLAKMMYFVTTLKQMI